MLDCNGYWDEMEQAANRGDFSEWVSLLVEETTEACDLPEHVPIVEITHHLVGLLFHAEMRASLVMLLNLHVACEDQRYIEHANGGRIEITDLIPEPADRPKPERVCDWLTRLFFGSKSPLLREEAPHDRD